MIALYFIVAFILIMQLVLLTLECGCTTAKEILKTLAVFIVIDLSMLFVLWVFLLITAQF